MALITKGLPLFVPSAYGVGKCSSEILVVSLVGLDSRLCTLKFEINFVKVLALYQSLLGGICVDSVAILLIALLRLCYINFILLLLFESLLDWCLELKGSREK